MDEKHIYAVVSAEAAESNSYPYVYVSDVGAVHELDLADRQYLETRFHPADGARPYIKATYNSKDGWGDLKGFCRRAAIPRDVPIEAQPILREQRISPMELVKSTLEDFDPSTVYNKDGSVTMTFIVKTGVRLAKR